MAASPNQPNLTSDEVRSKDSLPTSRTRIRTRMLTWLGTAMTLVATVVAVGAPPASARAAEVVREGESIQAAVDAAEPGDTIIVHGDHVENVWIQTDGLRLIGRNGSITMPEAAGPTASVCDLGDGFQSLICIAPADARDQAPPFSLPDVVQIPAAPVRNVSVSGFTLTNPRWDAISAIFTESVSITNNKVKASGCDGIWLFASSKARLNRNVIEQAFCNGIHAWAASDVRINRNHVSGAQFAGVSVEESQRSVVFRNSVTGNCMGVFIVDSPDAGYGLQDSPFRSENTRVTSNRVFANNSNCFLGEFPLGGGGILTVGASQVSIRNNTVVDNVVSDFSLNAGGIRIGSFPLPDGTFIPSSNVRVQGNTLRGNSSPAGPADIVVSGNGPGIRVGGNDCGVSVPDTSQCS